MNLLSLLGLAPQGVMDSLPMGMGLAQQMGPMSGEMEHKSPLGIGGKARDILGGIGDALLIANGRDPSYAMKRQQEKIGDVYGGYGQDPQGTISKIAAINPAIGQKLQEAYDKNQVDLHKDDLKHEEIIRNRVGAMLRSARPETYDAVRNQAIKYAQGKGVTLDGIPDKYDPKAVEAWSYGQMDLKDQLANEDRSTRTGIQADRANVYKETQRFNVRNQAARTQIQAAGVGVRAANTDLSQDRVNESGRHNRAMENKPSGRKGASLAPRASGSKPFRVGPDGTIQRRQPDGSYK